MDLAAYRRLHRLAAHLSRHVDEADDLLHDALLAGLEAGRDDAPWLAGVLRNQAALAARGAVRRKRREAWVAAADLEAVHEAPATPAAADPRPLLERLPPSARRLAVLVLHGLGADEIRWILGLSATAFRQRLTRIRRALATLTVDQREAVVATASTRHQRIGAQDAARPLGPLRRALQIAVRRAGEGVGTHDADGHLLVIRRGAHSSQGDGNETAGCPPQ